MMQIIVAALVMGVVMFAVVALVVMKPQQQPPFIAYVAVIFTAVVLGVRSVIPGIIAGAQRKRIGAGTWQYPNRGVQLALPTNATDGDRLLFAFQTKTIIEGALAEGPAFFLILAYTMTGQIWPLAVVFGLLALMGLQFPTRDRVESWVKNQLELLELEKSS